MDPSLFPGSTDLQSDDRAFSPTADSIAGRLFALTLTDDGPNANSIPNKLWSSCAEFQDTGPSIAMIADPLGWSSVLVADLAESLSRLAHQSMISSEQCSAPPLPLMDPSLLNSATPALVVGGRRLCKKDRRHCTVKALQLLNNIETRIHHSSRLLLEPSSLDSDKMQHEVLTLRLALEKITQNAHSISLKKKTLAPLLDDLELRVKLHLPASQGPVDVDTGT